MNIQQSLMLLPARVTPPAGVDEGCVPISTRFPRDGISAAYPASGTTGQAGTIVPVRSATECANYGATLVVWSYTHLATGYGYASQQAFIDELRAVVSLVQGTTNASAVSDVSGPYAIDLAGQPFSAGGASVRPAPIGGAARGTTTISFAPSCDTAGTKTPKLAVIASQAALHNAFHFDDPRGGGAPLGGFRGHRSEFDVTAQGADFSATALAAFPAWLAANTTSAERVAVGFPSDPTGFDFKAWLIANYPTAVYSAGTTDPVAIDVYKFRTTVSTIEVLRTVYLNWYQRHMRDDQIAYLRQVKAAAGVPLSLNLYAATPQDYMTWVARVASGIWDFAISEVPPAYWSQVSAYTPGTDAFTAARWAQTGAQRLQMATADMTGLLCLCEHKPTAPNQAPARVVQQMLRQSIMQTVSDGHVPVVPIDVFMTTAELSARDQGVDIDGYRFWGPSAQYADAFAFVRANRDLLVGYRKLAGVMLAVHNDSFPFRDGSRAAYYDTLCKRAGELFAGDVDYQLMPVGEASGTLPQLPDAFRESVSPLIIRLQNDSDYMSFLGRLSGGKYRPWSSDAVREAQQYTPVRSSSINVRATARYHPTRGRVSILLQNFALNSDGTPKPQTTTFFWRWGGAGQATVTRVGEADSTVDLSKGYAMVTLREFAIVNFAVS